MTVIILAAGKGTRMKSNKAKVLHSLHGKPLLKYVIDLAYKIKPENIFVVVGFQKDEVKKKFASEKVKFIDQKEQLGTAHAVKQVMPFLGNSKGEILVLSGDVPFLKKNTIKDMVRDHRLKKAVITILTVVKDSPVGYGRVIRSSNNLVERILEEKDCSQTEKNIKEINAGIYCVNKNYLLEYLGEIDKNNAQQEYYLTDIVKIAADNRLPVVAVKVKDHIEVSGINSREDLLEAEKIFVEP